MSTEFEPRIVSFLCDWCSHQTAATVDTGRRPIPSTVQAVGVTCTGRVDPLFLIMAYLRGADGVLVAGCQPGQCHYKEGNYHARRRMALLKNIFETLDLDAERLCIKWVSEAEAQPFAEIAAEFEEQIQRQGPNAVRGEIFC